MVTVYTGNYIHFSSNCNSCSKRLCPNLRKGDSCNSTLVIYNDFFWMGVICCFETVSDWLYKNDPIKWLEKMTIQLN